MVKNEVRQDTFFQQMLWDWQVVFGIFGGNAKNGDK
jgi:hypothetical protein